MTVPIITSNDLLAFVILITPCKAAVSEFDQVWEGGRTGVGEFLWRQAYSAEIQPASTLKAGELLEPDPSSRGPCPPCVCLQGLGESRVR